MAIPERTKRAIDLWATEAAPPPQHMSRFVHAVLTNNLADAFAYADDENREALHDTVRYVYNDVPSSAWGSRAKLDAWFSAHGRKVAA